MTAPYAAARSTAPRELVVDEAELGPGVFTYWGVRWPLWRQILLWITCVLFVCTVVLSPLGIWFIVAALRSPTYSKKARAKRVDLHQRGLVVHGVDGPVAVHRFEDVTVHQKITENYYNGVKTGTHYLLTLTAPDRTTSKLTQFYDNIPHLMQTVQQGVVEAQLPRVLATVQAGYPVVFGPFSVTRQGLVCDAKTTVTWPLLERVVIRQGVVRVMVHGRRTPQAAKAIYKIPNYTLFLTLISHLRAQG